MSRVPGQVVGTAAASLADSAGWADPGRAAIGAKGERATASVLNALAHVPGGPSVIHDARIPLPNVKANIDHMVVSGNNVLIIDSKMWKPGFYWTAFGRTFRGLSAFPSADKRTLPMAVDGITKFLAGRGIRANVRRPLLIVWPSNISTPINLTFLRSPGAASVTGAAFKAGGSRLIGKRPADPRVLAALAELVYVTR
jgi:hypothetical protein